MSRKPKRLSGFATVIVTLLILVIIAATAFVLWMCFDMVNQKVTPSTSGSTVVLPTSSQTEPVETDPPETTLPEPEHVVATATIGAQGDLLMHSGLFFASVSSVNNLGNGNYNFDSIFKYSTEYTSALDYAVINLETTFGGTNYPYQGNPEFNCPDTLADAAALAGYDMLLTANNHCSDTHTDGILRTLEVVRDRGLATLGTQLSNDEPKYEIVDINGIQVGMICYTYADGVTSDGRPSLNFRDYVSKVGLVNYFMESNLPKFYSEVEGLLAEMKEAGAEATMMYIHWDKEYKLTESATQDAIAQKLCDLGIDVIVGGHPHVVQPMDLLESTVDPSHKTVCIYSLGNAVSNQRLGNLTSISTAHTEDGVLFSVTFEKYSDGTVYISAADVLPTWVDMHSRNGGTEYNILPLDYDRVDEWMDMFDIPEATYNSAKASYDRTMEIVGEGLEECQSYLAQAKLDREEYYYDLAMNPAA